VAYELWVALLSYRRGWLNLATVACITWSNYPEKLPWPIPGNLLEEGQLCLAVSHSIKITSLSPRQTDIRRTADHVL